MAAKLVPFVADFIIMNTSYALRPFGKKNILHKCIKYVNDNKSSNEDKQDEIISELHNTIENDIGDEYEYTEIESFVRNLLYAYDSMWIADWPKSKEIKLYGFTDHHDQVHTVKSVIDNTFDNEDSNLSGYICFKCDREHDVLETAKSYYNILKSLDYCRMFEIDETQMYQTDDGTKILLVNVDSESG